MAPLNSACRRRFSCAAAWASANRSIMERRRGGGRSRSPVAQAGFGAVTPVRKRISWMTIRQKLETMK